MLIKLRLGGLSRLTKTAVLGISVQEYLPRYPAFGWVAAAWSTPAPGERKYNECTA